MTDTLHASQRAVVVWAGLGISAGNSVPHLLEMDRAAACGASATATALVFRGYDAHWLTKYQLARDEKLKAEAAAAKLARVTCAACRDWLEEAAKLRGDVLGERRQGLLAERHARLVAASALE